jgi:large subunit ribosomal protein L30
MPRTFVWHPRRGPAKTQKQNVPESGTVRIKQVRSGIGHSWRMRATLEAIGLKHHQDVVEKAITPALRGQLEQVRHLVEVTVLDGHGAAKAKPKAKAKAKPVEAEGTK